MKTKHTPLPWNRSQQAGYISVGPLMVANDNQEANAEFIIRAVNSHASMLAMLRALRISNAIPLVYEKKVDEIIAQAEAKS